MRPLAFLVLLLALGGMGEILRAQDLSPRWQNIINPDKSKGVLSAIQDKTFYSGGTSGLDTTKSANIKEFDIFQKFSLKSFETKDFSTKDYWQGEFQFTTKAAYVKTDSAADKIYATKPATEVKDASENGKGYDTSTYATREAVEKGKTSQEHLDEVYKGKTQLNMDQIRDLLDKNH